MSQQLVKKGTNGKHENVMPRSWIEAIKDKNTGQTLVEILQGFNMYFLPYNGNTSSTRCLVPTMLRKKGLWITYVKYDGNVYTEWYAADELDDKSWGDSSNWRVGNNTLVGDITISANGNWVINGTETEFKAVGEKGNTPLIRIANNRFQVSYDLGDTYRDVTNNPVYTKFRWLATSGDTQANNVGRIQASTDEGKTWTNMSNDFTNNLHIKKYIGVNESLPTSGIAEGTIYAKGPYYAEDDTLNDNPIYRLWVYAWKGNTLAWQDNGEFQSIAAGIVQETGDSETEVMSQKAVTEKLSELGQEVRFVSSSLYGKEESAEYSVPISSSRKLVGTLPFVAKSGTKIKVVLNYGFDVSEVGLRIYQNSVSNQIIAPTPSSTEYTHVLSEDCEKLLFYAGVNSSSGILGVSVTSNGEFALKEDLENVKDIFKSSLDDVNSDLHGVDNSYSFTQRITSARVLIGTIDVKIKKGETFKLIVSRNYTSLTGGRIYQNDIKNLLSDSIRNGEVAFTAEDNISKILFYDDSNTEGVMSVQLKTEGDFVTKSDVAELNEEYTEKINQLKTDIFGEDKYYEFQQPTSSGRVKIGEFAVSIKKGDVFSISVNRTYTSLTGGRMYQNSAPNLFSALPNGERKYEATIDIDKFVIYDDSDTDGVMMLTYTKDSKFASKTDIKNINPYKGLYGTVIGDSHAVRRASWVPQVYSRLGVNYEANVASFIVGQGNSCGEGYEDCIDPVFAQAKRAVESYNSGNKIDFILLDNVHYTYESDVMPVIPFKMNQIVDLGKFEGSSSQEKTWFNTNFSSLITKAEKKLGTTLKSTWARKKYDLTFNGTIVAGTTFSIIIDGKTYNTPINEGDTLTTFAERVATWVFGEEWTSTSKNNVVTITYNGSGSAPSLSISYEANESGIIMVSTEGEVESSVYRYYQRKDFVDWNNISAWGLVSNWFAGGLKGAVEYLLENIPTVKIVIISLPYYPIKKNDFLTELGQDQEAFLNSSTYISNRKRVTLMKNVAEYYNLPFVDFEKDAYISLSNYFNYFPENDVHPYKIGYERLADCICTKLGF